MMSHLPNTAKNVQKLCRAKIMRICAILDTNFLNYVNQILLEIILESDIYQTSGIVVIIDLFCVCALRGILVDFL